LKIKSSRKIEKALLNIMLTVQINHLKLNQFSLKNISFQLNRGQCLALIGPNGAGKTTLLKSIAGIYPQKNVIFWNNQPLQSKYVEYIPPFLEPQLSIQTRYFLEASLNKIRISLEDQERILKISRFLKIEALLTKDLKILSSGEMAKVLLAKSLLGKKPVILWDEPTSFLDLRYRFFLKKFVLYFKKKKIFIISTHDLKWAKQIADFYLGIKNGKQQLFDNHLTKEKAKQILF